MTAKGAGGFEWAEDAACAQPENLYLQNNFFASNVDKKYDAKNLCFSCPVREDCIRWALENKEIWGIWGGKDENEIRRTLSVNSEGEEVRRGRYPQCPYCGARTSKLSTKIIDLPEGGRWNTARVVVCSVCNFEWRSRSSANAVNAYFAERADKAARAKKKAAAKKQRPSSIKQLPSTGKLPDSQNSKALEVKPVRIDLEDQESGV